MRGKPFSGNRLRGDASREANHLGGSVIWGVEAWKTLDRRGVRMLLRHSCLAVRKGLQDIEDQNPCARPCLRRTMLATTEALVEVGCSSIC